MYAGNRYSGYGRGSYGQERYSGDFYGSSRYGANSYAKPREEEDRGYSRSLYSSDDDFEQRPASYASPAKSFSGFSGMGSRPRASAGISIM